MIVFAIISYAMPQMTGRKLYEGWIAEWAFWAANIGMICMTCAFAVAGVTQVYLERRLGMDFLQVQGAVQVHFVALALAACLFTLGIGLFVWNFVRYGLPNLETVQQGGVEPAAMAAK
jgi:nitric oxide reductase subunit B